MTTITTEKLTPTVGTLVEGVDQDRLLNDDSFPHTASADSGAWSSPELRQGERFHFVATRSGRFSYHCAAHPVMRATLIVRPRE